MSIIASTAQQICFAPTNCSPSKQLYSFSKASRFGLDKKNLNENVSYDIPTSFSRRAPSLGYGTRSSFIKNTDVPAPTAYQPKSDFDKVDPHARAFSFGIAREAYSKVYIKENPPLDKSIPGPGTYTVPPKIGAEASKYSMKGRTINHLMLTTTRYNPGPGAYDPKTGTNATGDYYVGSIKNSKAPTFSLPSLPRFRDDKQMQKPGPGTYSLHIGISDPSSTFLSKLQNLPSDHQRQELSIIVTERQLTSPETKNLFQDQITLPSDFGHYESKNKFLGLRGSQSQTTL